MPLPPFSNICDYVTRIPSRNKALSAESENPLAHLRRGINDCEKLVAFVDNLMNRVRTYRTSQENFAKLCEFAAVGAIEAFERFFKELAASCIDFVYEYVSDDRLDVFTMKGAAAAVHFEAGSVGRGLCESSTWLDNKEIAKRFRRILADPETEGNFEIFKNDGTAVSRQDIVAVLWQLRHSIVHNFGIINNSDAVKLRKLCRREVVGNVQISIRKTDFWYIKLFILEVAEAITDRVHARLSILLSSLVTSFPLADKADVAQRVANKFNRQTTIDGQVRDPS